MVKDGSSTRSPVTVMNYRKFESENWKGKHNTAPFHSQFVPDQAKNRMKHLIAMLFCMASGVCLLIIGYFARNVVLTSNGCEMTYSLKDKEEIFVGSKLASHMKLYKYHTETKISARKTLAPVPVLFVPGHRGE